MTKEDFGSCSAYAVAEALVELASALARDTSYLSPFATAANDAALSKRPWWNRDTRPVYMGGKLDDITVLVGLVE